MPRVAKIQLNADTQLLSQQVQAAKEIILSLNKTEVLPVTGALKTNALTALKDSSQNLKIKIEEIKSELAGIGSANADAFDPEHVNNLLRQVTQLNEQLEDSNRIIKQVERSSTNLGRIRFGAPPGAPGAPGGEGGGGMLGAAVGGLARHPMARMLGIGAGAGLMFAMYRRQLGVAQRNMPIRALTGMGGEATPVDPYGDLKFTYAERQQRAGEIARARGAYMGRGELAGEIQRGEVYERAFGVTGGQQAGVMRAGRMAGMGGDMGRLMPMLVQQAREGGLTGGRVTEYLDAMSNNIASMAEGVTIDTRSITEFSAGILAGSRFFQADPRRLAQVTQSLDQMFRAGDPFQQAQAARGIRRAAGEGGQALGPAAVEIRRRLGLWWGGEGGGEVRGRVARQEAAGGGDDLTRTLRTTGTEILNSIFQEIQETTEGRSYGFRALEFQQRTGLGMQQALEIFTKLEDVGGDLSKLTKIERKDIQKGMKKPEEIANTMLENIDGNILKLHTGLDSMFTTLGNAFASSISPVSDGVSALADKMEIGNESLTSIDKLIKDLIDIMTGAYVEEEARQEEREVQTDPSGTKAVGGARALMDWEGRMHEAMGGLTGALNANSGAIRQARLHPLPGSLKVGLGGIGHR